MPRRRGTALIVDDDLSVGQVLKDMVEGIGFAVTHVVHDDSAAYALFDADHRWDVAFVDLNLGKGGPTGVEVARRASERSNSVIVITGLPRLPDTLSGMGLLLKPFSVDQVRLILDNMNRPVGA